MNGIWILLCTIYIIVIDDESMDYEIKEEVNDSEEEGETKIAVVTFVVNKIGPIGGRFRYSIIITHIVLGFVYIISTIVFTRSNSIFTLEIITYLVLLLLGAICYQYYEGKVNLRSLQICTQLFILFLGVSGTRLLYALVGDLDFSDITALPARIVAATFLCWFFLLYRTLEVIEFTMNKESKFIREKS